MRSVNIHEAKTHLSTLLKEIEGTAHRIVICNNGKPVADLVAHGPADRLQPHPVMGRITIGYDPVQPLTSDEWSVEAR